jgi:hypothetical protein
MRRYPVQQADAITCFAAIEYSDEAAASDEGEKGSHRIRRLKRNAQTMRSA